MDLCLRKSPPLKKLFNVCSLSPPLLLFKEQRLTDSVWEKLKKDRRIKQMAEENKIEMEDDQGNVMSAKTYNDLRAQGII
jgi:hypothetical protein